jgi:hypothetical protein
MNQTESLYHELSSLGSHFSLAPFLSPSAVAEALIPFEKDWKIYNPAKPGYKRQGLSLTSLDGGLSGVPDLTSLLEHNKKHGTSYGELSFRKLTPVYEVCSPIHTLVKPFIPYLGRSHFIKFETGGFFPYHRDAYGKSSGSFRIFVPLYTHPARDYVFLLNQDRIHMEVGRPYFINTRLEHALFTFDGPSLCLVLNIELCAESVAAVHGMMHSI